MFLMYSSLLLSDKSFLSENKSCTTDSAPPLLTFATPYLKKSWSSKASSSRIAENTYLKVAKKWHLRQKLVNEFSTNQLQSRQRH